MKTVLVTYNSYAEFRLPDDVFLLSQEDNNEDNKVFGSWWIRWNVLYYVDEDLNVQEVHTVSIDTECKHPDTVEIIEDEKNY